MGENVATLELDFLNIFKATYMYKRYLKNDNRWYLKPVSFHSELKQVSPINIGIQRRY